ncbi:MAG: hypothetical protein U0796_11650 [Gemmatales bacterium]
MLSLVLLSVACAWLPDGEWIKFTPKDGSFTSQFPQSPQERANRTGTTWMLAARDRVYNIAKNPVPGGDNPSPRDINTALNTVRDNIIKRVEAKLISERAMEHHRIPAREYLFALPEDKGHLRLRCFVVKGFVWEVKVGGPKEYVAGKEAEAFLEGLIIK